MGDELAERQTPGLLPGKHAVFGANAEFAVHATGILIGSGIIVLLHGGDIGIHGFIQGADLVGGEKVAHVQESLQIEEKFIAFAHLKHGRALQEASPPTESDT